MPEIEYRPAREDDIPQLLALHQEVYGRTPEAEFYRWKFFAPIPGFDRPRLWLAAQEGRAVGCGGALPYSFWVDGIAYPSASLMEYHVLKELRRQGVQLQIHERLYDDLREAGVVYTMNMPNEIGAKFCPAMHQHPLFRSLWMRRGVSWVKSLFETVPQGRSVRVVSTPGAECVRLWERLRGAVNCCSVPDADWLRYRYLSCPGRTFELLVAEDFDGPCGMLVLGRKWFRKRREGVVAYCLVAPGDSETLRALVVAAAASARRAGLRGLRTLVSDSPGQRSLWAGLGFRVAEGDFVVHLRDSRGIAIPDSLASPEVFTPRLGDHDFV